MDPVASAMMWVRVDSLAAQALAKKEAERQRESALLEQAREEFNREHGHIARERAARYRRHRQAVLARRRARRMARLIFKQAARQGRVTR